MICPVDKNDMIVVEHGKIELDYCTRCRGVWFDSGELELLLDAAGVGNSKEWLSGILKAPEAKCNEKCHRCPICRHEMKKTALDADTIIDVCDRGHGLWFDGGEVGHLLKQLGPQAGGSNAQVADFLKEVFKAGDTP